MEGNSPPARVDWSSAPDNNGTVQLPNGNLLVRDFSRHNQPILCTNLIEEGDNSHYLLFSVTMEEENGEGSSEREREREMINILLWRVHVLYSREKS